jgi:hypothetical protein
MAGRQIDDQSSDPAFPHGGQLGGDDLDMPVHRELGLSFAVINMLVEPRSNKFAPDSPQEEAGFELLVPSINPARPVLTPDAMAGISVMFVFDAHLA